MAVSGFLALAALLLEYGFIPSGAARDALRILDVGCILVFAGLQAAKLLVVEEPFAYLKSHRVDFSLLFVLGVQTLVHLALRSTPEYLYLEQHDLPSPLWAFYVGLIQAYLITVVVLRSPWLHRMLIRLRLQPVQILVSSFLILIGAGAAALMLPGATTAEGSLGLLDAVFTATSAVCVTGLVVNDTGTAFTAMGHTVILVLIQCGGLGMITITAFFALFSGGPLSTKEKEALGHALEARTEEDMRRALRRILLATLIFETLGALALYAGWRPSIDNVVTRASWAVFHSVSAFCNAGFSLFPHDASLSGYAADAWTLGVVGGLIVVGGLGFAVLNNMMKSFVSLFRRSHRRRLSRQARWVLTVTAGLIVSGAVLFHLLEANRSLSGMDGSTAWLTSIFQSITLRTAGFSTFDLSHLGIPAVVLSCLWMLIGGSPGGTAGGVKTITIGVVAASLLGRRVVDSDTRRRAIRILLLFCGLFVAGGLLVSAAQGGLTRASLFETASALGTVGLSMGLTARLTVPAKIVVCVLMFVGRVGPFALAAAVLRRAGSAAPAPEPPHKEALILG